MKHRTCLALLTAALLTACARPTPEQQIARDAALALGGADKLLAVNTLVIEAEGTQYNLGQDLSPGASGETFAVAPYKRAIDLREMRARTELVRVPQFSFWQGVAPQRQVQGIDKAIGYNVAANGTATRIAQTAVDDRRAEFLRHPLTAVRAALDPAARLTNARSDGGQSIVDVLTSDNQAFTLSIDANTKRPARVTTQANNVNLGDVSVSTEFGGYENVDGLQLPTRLTSRTDNFTTAELRITRHVINGNAGDLAAPAAAASAPMPVATPPNVTVEQVSKGFWLLAGGSHHSAVIEFADHLVLIEAPQNDTRALAVIEKARALSPGKPLTHVVNSHHHFDHSGGIRAAVSEGLTVVTHQGNAAFIEDIVRRPHTRVPDALSKNPKPLKIETVADERVITDGSMTVQLFPTPSEHSETMLTGYLPRERALIVIDLYEPGEPVHMFAHRFLADVKKRKLRVERIVPLHNKIVPFAQLVKDAGMPRD